MKQDDTLLFLKLGGGFFLNLSAGFFAAIYIAPTPLEKLNSLMTCAICFGVSYYMERVLNSFKK